MRVPAAEDEPRRTDLRLVLVGAAAWVGALLARAYGGPAVLLPVLLVPVVVVGAVATRRGPAPLVTVLGVLVALGAGAGATVLRAEAVTQSPVTALAAEGAAVTLTGHVVTDPRTVEGRFADLVAVRLDVRDVTGRGDRFLLSAPVLVLGGPEWASVELGSEVTTTGRLAAADDPDLAALLLGGRAPEVVSPPGPAWRAATRLRTSIRTAVDHRPPEQAALVPALVDGDDAGLDPALEADFATTGLTHLTAVSGTNLTLVVGFLLVLARWVGVRGRWLMVVGALGVVGFVLLARTEPSVLRAAAMGTVGLLAFGLDGRDRALRALGLAVLVLVLLQPHLAAAAGFALSVLATAGIVLLGPGMRDALAGWLPRVLAEAVAVPLAAQLACTPVVAAISGQVSLVAVGANLLVGPVVGPATVLGLVAGLVGLPGGFAETVSRGPGTLAAWCVGWIVLVARRGADLPLPALTWGTGVLALAVLTLLTVLVALLAPWVLRRRVLAVLVVVVLVAVVGARVPLPGSSWPPTGWVAVACDVGQGDALVLRSGPGSAVVVDAGPEPALVDGCLGRLGVTQVPLVVLTHFHADHVDGLPGVLEDRAVGHVVTTRVHDPPSGAAQVADDLAAAGDAAAVPAPPGTVRVGDVVLQVLWPEPGPVTDGAGDGSGANDASVVLLAEVGGVRLLLTGDVEPTGQARIAAELGGADLGVDVLKVPHHGSAYQDLDWLTGLAAGTALVSVGADNDYGHPAPDVLSTLEAAGTAVHRTDEEGDLAVVPGPDGGPVTVVGR
ncbi:ComEC/Rec2 family competence protein [Nocardioides sp. AX2bis]|uniref:ComEC/Rec2 family competence protein n=1 Tax=Nocardioides sp. AX2bis TaxID=2653157 RepID=UPI0012F04B6C|nr:ComEC/Rec2 family competence protein [Nocardioides sp. AX2bis]VXB23880.1 Competence protein ComEC [Nocardioides sp. AX2bis]